MVYTHKNTYTTYTHIDVSNTCLETDMLFQRRKCSHMSQCTFLFLFQIYTCFDVHISLDTF